MSQLTPLTARLESLSDLDADEVRTAAGLLGSPDEPDDLKAGFLAALAAKGETAAEVAAFASAFRAMALDPGMGRWAPQAIDIVGTGGDGSGSLNLSTGAALLTAACGMPVVKHGNRSISSRCGSADLIEALGLRLPLDERRAARCFEATGFTFLFAPYYHPAMQSLGPVRAALGVRTIFNLLGPLTNPAEPRYALIGAYDAAAAALMAETVALDARRRSWIVHGAAGWDEVTPIGPFLAWEVDGGTALRREIDPATFGIAPCTAADLAGGDAAANLAALEAVFARQDRGAHREALVLQSGLALHIAGRAPSVEAGIGAARETIASGRAESWLAGLRRFGSEP